MSGTSYKNYVQIVNSNQTVEMNVDEVKPRRRSPMSQQSGLNVLQLQRRAQQRIVVKINLSHRKVVSRTPVCVHLPRFFSAQWFCFCYLNSDHLHEPLSLNKASNPYVHIHNTHWSSLSQIVFKTMASPA